MLIFVFIPYLVYVFATIAIKMATNLTDIYSLNSAMILTSKL